jgi:predicted  nucleic acid-binding Zn-ribbon protein
MENTPEDAPVDVSELEGRLESAQEKLEDAEDELAIILERSNSGQHTSSKYILSNRTRIEEDIEFLKDMIEKITAKIAGMNRFPG